MKKLLYFFLAIFVFFCSINETFALNGKNFGFKEITYSQLPDTSNPLNYCILWSGYDAQYLTLETEYDQSFNVFYFTCTWQRGYEKLSTGKKFIYLKDDDTPPPPPKIPGCTDPTAINYNAQATEDDGTCQARIEGCTDPTATNYNASANVHVESMCQYASPSNPSTPPIHPSTSTGNTQPPSSTPPSSPTYPAPPTKITGFFDNTVVPIGATIWTMKLHLNVENPTIRIQDLYIWDKFTVSSMNIDGKDITFNIEQTDGQRLEVEECTNYEITVPKNKINADVYDTNTNTMNTIQNFNEIRGNFTVEGCEHTISNINNTGSGNTTTFPNAELNEKSSYISVLAQKDGHYYVDIKALSTIFFYILLAFSVFYVIFKFFNKKVH